MVKGEKRYVETTAAALRIIRATLGDDVFASGSFGAWHYYKKQSGERIVVGEAWIHRTRPGWWLRISETVTVKSSEVNNMRQFDETHS
jgi:hypothetical protein